MIKPGDKFVDGMGEFRIMAVAEGYAMARRKGAVPFVVIAKELHKRFDIMPVPVPTPKEQS